MMSALPLTSACCNKRLITSQIRSHIEYLIHTNNILVLILYSKELILSNIIKTVATRCQILRLKFTKFDIGWGSAPDLAGGAFSAPPRSF